MFQFQEKKFGKKIRKQKKNSNFENKKKVQKISRNEQISKEEENFRFKSQDIKSKQKNVHLSAYTAKSKGQHNPINNKK